MNLNNLIARPGDASGHSEATISPCSLDASPTERTQRHNAAVVAHLYSDGCIFLWVHEGVIEVV